jgi:sugar phosphate isomerase/epimerase
MQMNISIASYSFHGLFKEGKMDLFGYLESCKFRYHVQSADIWSDMFKSMDEDFLKKVKEGLKERELVLANLCVDGPDIWVNDPAAREKNYKDALTYLRTAEFLEARTIRFNSGGKGDTFTEEQFDLVVKRFKEYAQFAYDRGFKVGPENHWGPEVVPENMKRICEAVNHPGFGMLLHFRGNPGDALMAPWAMHTHISWDIAENHLEESLKTLLTVGYKGYWGVEHHSAKDEYYMVSIQLAKVRNGVYQLTKNG